MTDAPQLSKRARACFLDNDRRLLLSLASVWEMAIKISIGKLTLATSLDALLDEELPRQGIGIQPIELSHALAVRALPFHHHDPFDRLLVAQARCEGFGLLSRDKVFDRYAVERIW